MANLGHIDLVVTIAQLQAALRALGDEQDLRLSRLEGLALAQAYRQAKDPAWGHRSIPAPSSDRGVALARTLGLLAVHHQMAPVLAEVHAARCAATQARDAVSRLLQASAALRALGQRGVPLLEATKPAAAALQAISSALLRMGPSLTELNEAGRNDELLMNAMRELAGAFRDAEIARLVDDRLGGTLTQRRDRVRRRRRELSKYPPGYSEGFFVSA